MGRAPCCEKVGMKKGRWTAEEDEKLFNYITANGEGSWRSLPKNAGLLRCGKSCRLRWINYLRADLRRGNITKEEEEVIVKLHATLGNRWSLIAENLPGRTDNEIKNYWNSHLSRRLHSFRKIGSDKNEIVMMVLDKVPGGGRRRCGRTSRSAMKMNSTTNLPTGNKPDKHDHMDCRPEHSEKRSNITTIDPCQFSTTTDEVDRNLLSVTNEDFGPMGPLSPFSQTVDNGLWDPDDLFVGVEEESVGSGAQQALVVYGGLGAHQKEAEAGPGPAQVRKQLLDWDLEGIEAKLLDEKGEMGSWQWDNNDDNWNFDVQEIEGCYGQVESYASWLLSDTM